MTKRLLIFVVLAVVLVGGGLFYYRLHNAENAGDTGDGRRHARRRRCQGRRDRHARSR